MTLNLIKGLGLGCAGVGLGLGVAGVVLGWCWFVLGGGAGLGWVAWGSSWLVLVSGWRFFLFALLVSGGL